jgi:hypothetical protein
MSWGQWGKGYTPDELDSAQHKFGLAFPPDLIALLLDGVRWMDTTGAMKPR